MKYMGLFSKLKKKVSKDLEESQKPTVSEEKRSDVFEKSTKSESKEIRKKDKKPVNIEEVSDLKATGDSYKILLRQFISEKSAELADRNQYIFEIAEDANKSMVRKAIQKVYNVKPEKVNIINQVGKIVRYGKTTGKRKDRRKAIVILPKGQKIEIFEGV